MKLATGIARDFGTGEELACVEGLWLAQKRSQPTMTITNFRVSMRRAFRNLASEAISTLRLIEFHQSVGFRLNPRKEAATE